MSEPARPDPSGRELERPDLEKAALPVRASDAEREQVAEAVRRAVGEGRLTLVEGDERLAGVYATVHRGELATFTADLGEVAPTAADPGAAPAPRRHAPLGPRPATSWSVGVMSGACRRADWTPGLRHVAVALMGGVELTLREARLDDAGLTIEALAMMGGVQIDLRGADLRGGVTVRAVAIMGGIEVIVDPGTRVEEHGFALMGGFDDQSGAAEVPDGPVVRVSGFALMGGVSVERKPVGAAGDESGELPAGGDDEGEHRRRGIH